MSQKVFSNTTIVVTWLEPKKDRGKTSRIKARNVVKPTRKNLTAGITAFVRWKSSGRVYKAIINAIEGLEGKDTCFLL